MDVYQPIAEILVSGPLLIALVAAARRVERGLFRPEIARPAGTPRGAGRLRTLRVERARFERGLYLFVRDRPWSYGVASVVTALAAGWAASAAFRRN